MCARARGSQRTTSVGYLLDSSALGLGKLGEPLRSYLLDQAGKLQVL